MVSIGAILNLTVWQGWGVQSSLQQTITYTPSLRKLSCIGKYNAIMHHTECSVIDYFLCQNWALLFSLLQIQISLCSLDRRREDAMLQLPIRVSMTSSVLLFYHSGKNTLHIVSPLLYIMSISNSMFKRIVNGFTGTN